MKSLLFASILTCFTAYLFMSLIDTNNQHWLLKIPSWFGFPIIITICVAYLIALFFGVKGIFQEQRFANAIGILLSVFGIILFVLIISMQIGKNKARKGQFDYIITAENSTEISMLQPILDQCHLAKNSIKMVEYWNLFSSNDTISICMNKNKIIGLSIKNVVITDVSCISKLDNLSSLTINNCGLIKIENLILPKAERLNLNNNLLSNLLGIDAPKVKWLDVENNKLESLKGIENIPNAMYFNYAGNSITDFSATINHSFLNNLNTQK